MKPAELHHLQKAAMQKSLFRLINLINISRWLKRDLKMHLYSGSYFLILSPINLATPIRQYDPRAGPTQLENHYFAGLCYLKA